MLLQRLATGATAVKQARYRRRPTRPVRGSEALVRACAVYAQPVYGHCMYGRSLALAVQYEFRRGFCIFVLSLLSDCSAAAEEHEEAVLWPAV